MSQECGSYHSKHHTWMWDSHSGSCTEHQCSHHAKASNVTSAGRERRVGGPTEAQEHPNGHTPTDKRVTVSNVRDATSKRVA